VTLASVALPGMNGFIGEFLILLGAFGAGFDHHRMYTAIAATGVILSAVYMLWMFQRVNYGPVTNPKNRALRDLSVREWFVIAPICAMAIFMGVVPNVFLRPMEPSVRRTLQEIVGTGAPVNTLNQTTPPPVADVPAPAAPDVAAPDVPKAATPPVPANPTRPTNPR
jgi:NADH-quinone oxidoreductase subunit M